MLKFGESCNVYMKRVWIFDETLSPACFIYYYTLASPQATQCLLICVATILFPSQRASKAVPAKCGKELRASKGFRGERGRGKLSFPPLTIPFLSLSAWPKYSSRSSYSLTWKERVPHTCKKTQSCLRSRLINYT